jgi:hypothetical protein
MDALRRSVEAERSGSERSKSERPAAAHRRTAIDGRMMGLAELLKRTDTLNIRTDFDPAKFE